MYIFVCVYIIHNNFSICPEQSKCSFLLMLIEDHNYHGYGCLKTSSKATVPLELTHTHTQCRRIYEWPVRPFACTPHWGLKFFSWSMKPGFGHDTGLDDFTWENASLNDWPSLHIRYPMTTETARDTPVLQWTSTTPFC